jgi:PIN domain nuclease of toxin-antitoxin system
MSEPVVLDASALLALMAGEPGQEAVLAALPGARMSAVNLAEVVSKLAERGMPADEAWADARDLGFVIVPFDAEQAREVGRLRPLTRTYGLSLGDRACLALASIEKARVLTTDSRWRAAADALDITIEDIRRGSPRH